MKLKKVLITGGCGFLGQYLTKDLLEGFPGMDIKILDLKANPAPLLDFGTDPRVNVFLNKDICNYDSIKDDFKDVDCVIHLAGIVSFSLKDKELLENVNIGGTKNIIKAVKENCIKNFIHISSVAALGYSDDKYNPIDESFVFDWKIAEKKKKYYMLTKHLADMEIEKCRKNSECRKNSKCKKEDINAVIVYPGLLFGAGDFTNSAKLIKAIKDKRIPFNMPGGTNIIDVRDVSKGIIAVLKKDIVNGNYLLSGHNLKFKEVNQIIADEVSVKSPKITLPRLLNPLLFRLMLLIESTSKNKTELPADNLDSAFKFRYFDNTKAKKELGWEPQIKFEQTIKDTVVWMKDNNHF